MPRFAVSADTMAPGLGKLAMALGGGQAYFDKGRDDEVLLQSKLAQAIAAMQAHESTAALNNAKVGDLTAAAQARSPDAIRSTAMLSNGVPLDEADTVNNYLQTGALGGKYAPAADGYGPSLPAPDWAANLGPVARTIAGVQRALTIGDKNSEHIAKAGSIERGDRLSDAVIAGTADRNTVAGAQAAVDGKPLFHMDGTGGVLDQYGGALDTSNPLAQSTIGLRGAQAGNQTAGAAAHYAQAEAERALAEQRRAITAGPGGKVPIGYRYVTGQDGEPRLEPIPGGPKDPNAQTGKPLPAAAAKGYLDNLQNLQRAEKALALVTGVQVGNEAGDPNATGYKGFLPETILNRVDPAGTATRAALADLGSLVIHDRSGAAVTAAEFPRLAPFIPSPHDNATTVKKKLQLFVDNYRNLIDQSTDFYKSSGYNVPKMNTGIPGAAPAAAPAATGWKIERVPGS